MLARRCDCCGKYFDYVSGWSGDESDYRAKYTLGKNNYDEDRPIYGCIEAIEEEMHLCNDCQEKFDMLVDNFLNPPKTLSGEEDFDVWFPRGNSK